MAALITLQNMTTRSNQNQIADDLEPVEIFCTQIKEYFQLWNENNNNKAINVKDSREARPLSAKSNPTWTKRILWLG